MKRRTFLVAGSMLALVGFAGSPLRADGGTFTVDGRVALNAYRGLVEEHLTGILNALKALAATADAQSGGWERIRPALQALGAELTTDAAVWLALPDGSYRTAENGLSDQNLKDRDYFPGLMAGRDVVGTLVVSKSTGHRSIIVATPVTKGGAVIAALGVSVRARFVSELVKKRTGLPEGVIFYALDAAGRTAIHEDAALMFQYPSDLGDDSLKAAVATILSSDEGSVDYQFRGRPRTALFCRSALTGWHFVLARVGG